jgi:hypothetical protein
LCSCLVVNYRITIVATCATFIPVENSIRLKKVSDTIEKPWFMIIFIDRLSDILLLSAN